MLSSSSSSSWYRVALGIQMVAQAATQSAFSRVGRVTLQTSQHLVEMVTNNQRLLCQQGQEQGQQPQPPPLPPQQQEQEHGVPNHTTTLATTAATTTTASPDQFHHPDHHNTVIDTTRKVDERWNSSSNQAENHPTADSTLVQMQQQQQQQLLQPNASSLWQDDTFIAYKASSSSDPLVVDKVSTTVESRSTFKSETKGHSSLHDSLEPLDATTTTTRNESQISNENRIHSLDIQNDASDASSPMDQTEEDDNKNDTRRLQEGRAVPSTRMGRAWGFAQLGMGLALGAAAEGMSRVWGGRSHRRHERNGNGHGNSWMVTESNSNRLATSLCRMRGAALKMGQMLSIQDESLLPPALSRALQQVRQGAEAMPKRQLEQQMESQLGSNWRQEFFTTFDDIPFAAASIGQVHRATIVDPTNSSNSSSSRNTPRLIPVVVKVQYPGVAQSIESDLRNLALLVTMTGLSPKGLFIENVIRVGQQELQVECDYLRELDNQRRIRQLVQEDDVLRTNHLVVPNVFPSHFTAQVLTSEYISGGTIDKVSNLNQNERNRIGRSILYLTMKELFEWRFMQTDPNWGNFLYDVGTQTAGLIDFGAAREYSKHFVDGYIRIVWASANRDVDTLLEQSHRMQFLTGNENDEMLYAHQQSAFTVGEPFFVVTDKKDNKQYAPNTPFDFRASNISTRMGQHTSVFLRHRLTPPPEEVYTLHRKLAGAYMLCIKLGSIVECRSILEEFVRNHKFDDGLPHPISG